MLNAEPGYGGDGCDFLPGHLILIHFWCSPKMWSCRWAVRLPESAVGQRNLRVRGVPVGSALRLNAEALAHSAVYVGLAATFRWVPRMLIA